MAKTATEETTSTAPELPPVDMDKLEGMSPKEKVVFLATEAGFTRPQIAEYLGIKYNFVQRVLRGNSDVASTAGSGGRAKTVTWEGQELPRTQVIKQLAGEGKSTSEIAKALEIPYQYVYRTLQTAGIKPTSSGSGGRGRIMLEFEGQTLPRSEIMRILAGRGMTRGQIARKLGVAYQIVFQTLKNSGTEVKSAAEAKAEVSEVVEENDNTDED